ncbi:PEP/pyruvate-binding domain-containing protein [Streptomyces sp. NPDC018059]|uniref:PEP/pyruvate-binding domain-containing protein n=1 Tax=Streptomyces sp. NPDC018059 TaxID=3365041 RepID=UPI0037B35893
MRFGTKAETLSGLLPRVRGASVLPLVYFTVGEWQREPADVRRRIRRCSWSDAPLVVRSSSLGEDGEGASNAGRYTSCLDVHTDRDLTRAIDAVIASFGEPDDQDQVLVQPQLTDAMASGVCSSCEPSTGAPYRLVNWSEGADTTLVTAGQPGVRSWYFLPDEGSHPPTWYLADLPRLAAELEHLLGEAPFEFEFAVRQDASLVLFQARPLAARASGLITSRHRAAVHQCQRKFRALLRDQPPSIGSDTCLGVMPDWNPAEMIGLRPRPLALSLYRHLITDGIWAESRHRYGYRDVRGVPLLVDLGGLPYIDIRASFSSLMPHDMEEEAAHRLMRHYLGRLRDHPHLHDKIEFEVVQSSYDFALPRVAGSWVDEGILSSHQATEFVGALHLLTVQMMAKDGPYRRDLHTARQLALRSLGRAPGTDPQEHFRSLLSLCRREGALPFAGIARAAFTATRLVRSLVERGAVSAHEADALLGSADTVSNQLRRDFATGDRETFLRRYGHLRPGTYDILSPRYDESDGQYFDWSSPASTVPDEPAEFHLDAGRARKVGQLLAEHGMPASAGDFLDFVRGSVAGREYAKLQYSRVVSEILTQARMIGERLGLTPADLSYVPVDALAACTGDRKKDRSRLAAAVAQGRDAHEVTMSLHGPALLCGPEELVSFTALDVEPNFVAHARVVAPVADVDAGDPLDGAIAMIPAADPGYDWIFTHNIVGLVTAFGGANSHMAIRALELGLPAVIGAGDTRFQQWLAADSLEIDTSNRLVRPTVSVRSRRSA